MEWKANVELGALFGTVTYGLHRSWWRGWAGLISLLLVKLTSPPCPPQLILWRAAGSVGHQNNNCSQRQFRPDTAIAACVLTGIHICLEKITTLCRSGFFKNKYIFFVMTFAFGGILNFCWKNHLEPAGAGISGNPRRIGER